MGELDRVVDAVAGDQRRFAPAGQFDGNMAGGVTGSREQAQSRDDLHALGRDVDPVEQASLAVERLRPDSGPEDHGDLRSDLTAWAEQFLDEMTSASGRAYIRDALLGDPDGGNAGQCSAYAAEQINAILARAADRGENTPDVEAAMDHVVAPMMYRILFRPAGLDAAYARRLVTDFLGARGGGRPVTG